MGNDSKYSLIPVDVPKVETANRRIVTALPVPESLPIFEKLHRYEPRSMQGQPPIVWDHAEGFHVYDKWGNMWLDWSSCVLVANAGHGRKEMVDAIVAMAQRPLLATYVFPHEDRGTLCEMLAGCAPEGLEKVFLLSTGSEATECCVKLARTYGIKKGGTKKHVIVSFQWAFHGRTMGAQMAGGLPALKEWIADAPAGFVNVPFPDGFRNTETDFAAFEKTLADAGVNPDEVAGVITESYQGAGPHFLPKEYAQKLAAWCKKHDVVLIMDEVQAGFGRTGKFFMFEHYDLVPDLIACGKGISSSLPLSAVIGRAEIMDLYAPGSMTSTHSASPLPVAASIANLKLLKDEKLTENAARLQVPLERELKKIADKYPAVAGYVFIKGLVAGIQIVKPGTTDPDGDLAQRINEKAFHKGLLMFAPVGLGGACIKIAPPLTITEEALLEGCAVLAEAFDEVLG